MLGTFCRKMMHMAIDNLMPKIPFSNEISKPQPPSSFQEVSEKAFIEK